MIADVRNFAAPIMYQRQQERNALASQMGMPGLQNNGGASLGGSGPMPQYNALATFGGPTREAAVASTAPTGEMAGRIYGGLVQRGLPNHVAEAFVLNMKDESGLNPGINEAEPIVPGSRGGFGLYQTTGPRRRAYEAFAAERGAFLDDVDTQLDFLMTELKGPEARAAQSIMSADNVNDAAVAIVRDFLRPAEEHRNRRINKYRSYSGGADFAQSPVYRGEANDMPREQMDRREPFTMPEGGMQFDDLLRLVGA